MGNNYDYIGNIRGPQGYSIDTTDIDEDGHLRVHISDGQTVDAGVVVGPQGLPGTDAVPADDAVGGYIGTAGTSASKAAVLGVGDARWPRIRQAVMEVNEEYAGFVDGTPTTALTGQTYKTRGSDGLAANLPVIESGFLTQAVDANGGAYAEIGPHISSVNRWGARWKFEPESVSGAVMCLALMTKSYVDYANATGNVPKSGPHLIITKNTLQLTVFPSDGSAPVDSGLGVITFNAGLAMDDTTIHSVELYLDNQSGRVFIYAPDGQMYSVQNDYYKDVFPWAYAEPFRSATYTAGMSRAKFQKWWASSVSAAEIARVAADYWSRPQYRRKVTASTDVGFALTSTYSRPAGNLSTFSFVTPPNPRVRIEAEFFIDVTAVVAGSQVRFGLQDGSGSLLTYEIVAMAVSHSGLCKAIFEHSLAEAVGSVATRQIAFAFVTAGTAAALLLKPQVSGSIIVTSIV